MAEQADYIEGRYGDWEPETVVTRKMPALQVASIHGVLPYSGWRNPMTRSNTARRVSMAFATPATEGVRRVYHFESEGESAVAIDALLNPDLFELEVQLPPVTYFSRTARKRRKHSFDMRITFRDGFRRAYFIRHAASLARLDTQAEIADLFSEVPPEFADDCVVVRTDDYSRAYRDNLRQVWDVWNKEDEAADTEVERVARRDGYWLLRDLIGRCQIEPSRCFDASLRLIGRKVLRADWNALINYYSRVELRR